MQITIVELCLYPKKTDILNRPGKMNIYFIYEEYKVHAD